MNTTAQPLLIDGYNVRWEQEEPETQVTRFYIQAPRTLVEHTMDHHLGDVAKRVRIPGFRSGHAPLSLLRKQYGSQLLPDVIQQLVHKCYQAALDKTQLVAAMDPQFKMEKSGIDSDLSFSVEIVPLPPFAMSQLDGLTIERLAPDPSEEELEKTLEQVAQANRELQEAPSDHTTIEGDVVSVDFKGSKDGSAIDGAAGENVQITLGSGRFIEEFEKALLGRKKGDQYHANVPFPQDYPSQNLAGQIIDFSLHVRQIFLQEPTSIDDALAKRLNLKSLEDLRKVIKANLVEQMNSVVSDVEARRLLDALHETVDITAPPKMIAMEFEGLWAEYLRQKESGDLTLAEQELSEPEQRRRLMDMAKRRVTLALVLTHVSREQNIGITDQEWAHILQSEARQANSSVEKIRQQLATNPKLESTMRAAVLERKLIRFLVERISTQPKSVTFAELEKIQQTLLDEDSPSSSPADDQASSNTKTPPKASKTKARTTPVTKSSTANNPAAKSTKTAAKKSQKKPTATVKPQKDPS